MLLSAMGWRCLGLRSAGSADLSRLDNLPSLANSLGSTRNPWLAWWDRGGRSFSKTMGASSKYTLLQTENSTDRWEHGVNNVLQRWAGRAVFNVNVPSPGQASRMIELLSASHVYFVTHFFLPKDEDWQANQYHVAHISADEEGFAAATAAYLLRAAGGKGRFVALGGNSPDESARRRRAGLEAFVTRSPGMELIAFQNANWEASSAFEIMRWWLAQYGRRISGIWAANDDMALGAIEALRTHSLAGRLPVTGIDGLQVATNAIRRGEMLATIVSDAFWLGGIGLALANAAYTGAIDVLSQPQEHRQFNGLYHLLTRDNVDSFEAYRGSSDAPVDWSDFWPRDSSSIESNWPKT
jgi:ribose transport system substrate-binding protein